MTTTTKLKLNTKEMFSTKVKKKLEMPLGIFKYGASLGLSYMQ